MAHEGPVENAVRRLNAALASLDVALSRRESGSKLIADLRQEVQTISEDRSRLAQELDRANERAARLEQVSDEIDRKLEWAIASLEEVLDEADA